MTIYTLLIDFQIIEITASGIGDLYDQLRAKFPNALSIHFVSLRKS